LRRQDAKGAKKTESKSLNAKEFIDHGKR